MYKLINIKHQFFKLKYLYAKLKKKIAKITLKIITYSYNSSCIESLKANHVIK